DSCHNLHDGNTHIILKKMVNCSGFENVELTEKILDPSFGTIVYGDLFCMFKDGENWEFAE
ncbi:MAG TPA: hypothetical protein VMX17_11710, partial [Candidatus Glassbacteria bacterium]|nr:hypothetical protein [Candidatus Glassbacteria bacterium]